MFISLLFPGTQVNSHSPRIYRWGLTDMRIRLESRPHQELKKWGQTNFEEIKKPCFEVISAGQENLRILHRSKWHGPPRNEIAFRVQLD